MVLYKQTCFQPILCFRSSVQRCGSYRLFLTNWKGEHILKVPFQALSSASGQCCSATSGSNYEGCNCAARSAVDSSSRKFVSYSLRHQKGMRLQDIPRHSGEEGLQRQRKHSVSMQHEMVTPSIHPSCNNYLYMVRSLTFVSAAVKIQLNQNLCMFTTLLLHRSKHVPMPTYSFLSHKTAVCNDTTGKSVDDIFWKDEALPRRESSAVLWLCQLHV